MFFKYVNFIKIKITESEKEEWTLYDKKTKSLIIKAQVLKNYENIILPDKYEIYNLLNNTLLRNEI